MKKHIIDFERDDIREYRNKPLKIKIKEYGSDKSKTIYGQIIRTILAANFPNKPARITIQLVDGKTDTYDIFEIEDISIIEK